MTRFKTNREVFKKPTSEIDEKKESFIQKKYFSWIVENQEKYPQLKTIFHIPNGIHTANFGMIVHFKQLGLRKGVWDIFIPLYISGHSGLWIEFKRADGKGKLTSEQVEFKKLILEHTENRPLFVVVNSCEEAIKETVDYLGLDYDYGRERTENFSPVFKDNKDEE